ncbi:MAG: hypothetical protein JW867_07300 [Candidatus Omnitrophica bacterium]|nr:hypothetical protein [Candidatus Omnitrophota bacterium]
MAIVAILAVAIVPVIASARQNARISKMLQIMEALKTAAVLFYADTGQYGMLTTKDNFAVNNNLLADDGITGWDGPYIDRKFTADDNPFGSIITLYKAYPVPFDLDSDGIQDRGMGFPGNVIGFEVDSQEAAQKIDQIIDQDGISGFWRSRGRCQYRLSFDIFPQRLFVFIAVYDNQP